MTQEQNRRGLKLLIIATGFILIFLFVIIFFANNKLVFLNASTTIDNVPISVYTTRDGILARAGSPGLMIVPRSTTGLVVTAGDYARTITTLKSPWYGVVTKDVSVEPVHNATKQAFMSNDENLCATYDGAREALLSFDCSEPTSLRQFQTPPDGQWDNANIAKLSYPENQVLPPYLGGVLGFVIDETTDALSLTASNQSTTTTYPSPSELNLANAAGTRLFTDTNDTTNGNFVIVDASGVIYLAKHDPSQKTIAYKRVAAPNDYSRRDNHTFCSVDGDSTTCYRGIAREDLEDNATYAQPSISTFSFTDGQVDSRPVDNSPLVNSFYVTTDGRYFGQAGDTLYAFSPQSNSFTTRKFDQSVTMVSADEELYFVSGEGIFTIDSETLDSRLLFSSPTITITSVYAVDGKVFTLGKHANDDSDAWHAYELTDETDRVPGSRLIDAVPFADNDLSGIVSSNLVDDTIQIIYETGGNPQELTTTAIDSLRARGITVPRDAIITVEK